MLTIPTLLLTLAVAGFGADPLAAKKDPPKPLADLARDLRDPDRSKRLAAAEAIRDHYKGKSLDALPQVIGTLGDYLDQPQMLRDSRLYSAIRDIVTDAGPGLVKAAEESTCHTEARVRAAGFLIWTWYMVSGKADDPSAKVKPATVLAAVRRGMKDESPLVRSHAILALHGVKDAPPAEIDEAVKLLVMAFDDWVPPREGRTNEDNPAITAALTLVAYGAKAKPAFGALVVTIGKDRDTTLAAYLCMAVAEIAKGDPKIIDEAVKVFRSVFTDKQRPGTVRESAIRGLAKIGTTPAVRWAIPDLVDLLEDPQTSVMVRLAAATAFESMGPRAAPAVPALMDRLEKTTAEWEQFCFAPLRKDPWMIGALGLHFPPWINYEDVVRRLWGEQSGILAALKAIGPAAAPVAERLEKWMEKHKDPRLREQVHAALRAIEK